MRRLVVSADDFGIAKSVNEGIVKACRDGIVTNLNFIPAGDAFHDALTLARAIGLTEAGAHLALTEISPVSEPSSIPTLIARKGRFRAHYGNFFLDLFLKKVDLEEVYIELKAQLSRAVKTGIRITSLSSHEHIHMMPVMLGIFIKLALEYDIPFVRCLRKETAIPPVTAWKIGKNLTISGLGDNARKAIEGSGLGCTDHFMGLLDSGNMDEEKLLKLIGSLEEGSTELVTHPGFVGPKVVDAYRFHLKCESELFALTGKRSRQALKDRGVKLVKYGELNNK